MTLRLARLVAFSHLARQPVWDLALDGSGGRGHPSLGGALAERWRVRWEAWIWQAGSSVAEAVIIARWSNQLP